MCTPDTPFIFKVEISDIINIQNHQLVILAT